MSKHTPGPWEAAEHGEYSDYDGECRVILGDDLRIAVVLGYANEETHANARLIAAAPDLLAALEAVMDEARPDAAFNEAYRGIWMDAEAAIDKARGES